MPNQIQSRELPVRTMRMTASAQPIQKSGSKAFMERKWSMARTPGASRKQRAARPCAKRPPPSSRARSPVRSDLGGAGEGGGQTDAGEGVTEEGARDFRD